jgi:hypothetical protein
MGLITKTYWLTDRQSQCNFDFDFDFSQLWDIRQPMKTLTEDIVKIRYQVTTGEDIEGWMCAAVTVIFRMCKPVRLLWLLAVTIFKWLVNPITNPIQSPSIVTRTLDNIIWATDSVIK